MTAEEEDRGDQGQPTGDKNPPVTPSQSEATWDSRSSAGEAELTLPNRSTTSSGRRSEALTSPGPIGPRAEICWENFCLQRRGGHDNRKRESHDPDHCRSGVPRKPAVRRGAPWPRPTVPSR